VVKKMRAELRADGLHISGYVNVPGRQSRPVLTPRGRVIEIIEQRAFARAIERAGGNIKMLLDHDRGRILADTEHGTLKVKEDEVGLRAESIVTDKDVIDGAKAGRLRGWSFNMKNVKDELEERAEGLPIRKVKDFDMDEITLVMNKVPIYSSTSIEVRAGEEQEVETRAICLEADYIEETRKIPVDYSDYEKRLAKIKEN
jgi:HK97 family phage prohead protease